MSEVISPVILVGPTTVGKTDIAKTVVDMVDGHLVNSDRHYFYAGDDLSLGLGLEHEELNDGRQRHLYGGRNPHEAPPTTAEYLHQVAAEVDAIHNLGSVAVIEGCTRRYAVGLMQYYGTEHAVGITWADRNGLEDMIRTRIAVLNRSGLYEETEQAISIGYGETFPMTALMYRVAARVVRNELKPCDAEDMIVKEWTEIASTHDEMYANIPDLARFKHDRSRTEEVATEIVSIMRLKPGYGALIR